MQRAIWAALGLILFAATLGAFGNGPLSAATASSDSGNCRIRFQRFIRNHSPTELHVRASSDSGRSLLLNISRAYLDGCRMTQVTPEPLRSVAFADRIQLEFAVPCFAQDSEIILRFDVQAIGSIQCGIWAGTSEEPAPAGVVHIRQFSFP